jgi:hypothetical protein
MGMQISFKACLTEIPVPVRGIIYCGNEVGGQAGIFSDQKVNSVLWLESNKNRLPDLYNQTKKYPLQQQYVTEVFSDKDIRGSTVRFDSFYKNNMAMVELEKFDLIVLDLDDRTELDVLNGFVSLFSKYTNIKAIHMKVRGAPDADALLSQYGFERKLTKVNDIGWGEALYVRN